MKIIGNTDDGFIIQATNDETYRLIGYFSQYSDGRPTIKVGSEIPVNKMYNQLYHLSYHKKEIMEMQAKLRAAATLLDEVDPITLPPPPEQPF